MAEAIWVDGWMEVGWQVVWTRCSYMGVCPVRVSNSHSCFLCVQSAGVVITCVCVCSVSLCPHKMEYFMIRVVGVYTVYVIKYVTALRL